VLLLIDILPIAITILKLGDEYLFIKRNKHPYKNLWSLVGGKINVGEHIRAAAIREIQEETGCTDIIDYEYRGFVSERLIEDEMLSKHFFIFVSYAGIEKFKANHREGDLRLFSIEEINNQQDQFLPSDWHMFHVFKSLERTPSMYEVELVYQNEKYELTYFRKAGN
jgi:ADP-ribose pyrophosphatase YjhB (NUDIX family)